MANFAIKAVVSNPDGSLFYSESHEWANLPTDVQKWMDDHLDAIDADVKKAGTNKEDGANLTVTLSRTGKPDLVQAGISYHELTRFERRFQKLGDELVKKGEDKAKHKK